MFHIILYILVILFALIGMCLSLIVFIVMYKHRDTLRQHRTDYLLLMNSYLPLFTVTPFFTDMCIHSIYGYFHPTSDFQGFSCRFKAYVMYIHGYVYFYSFLLQSIYRFCRIVYHTHSNLQSFRIYVILSILLWVNGFWQMLPCLLYRYVDYLPDEYHCQFPLSDLFASLIGLSINFLIPYILTLICYIITMCYVRKRSAELIGINRRLSIRRDIIILRRIVILLTLVTFVALPHVILPFIHLWLGELPSWMCPLEWLTTTIALTCVAIIQIFIIPAFKKLFIR